MLPPPKYICDMCGFMTDNKNTTIPCTQGTNIPHYFREILSSKVNLTSSTIVYKERLQLALQNYLSSLPGVPSESLDNTPLRFIKALEEMLSGYQDNPKEILSKTFLSDEKEQCDEIIILKDISFTSLCEHHLLNFSGNVSIGYLPGKVVGISKLARLVDCFANRLQMQERLTKNIADAIMTHLEAKGVAVVVKGQHSCMQCRGVKKSGSTMITSCCLGVFRDDHSAKEEFLMLCKD